MCFIQCHQFRLLDTITVIFMYDLRVKQVLLPFYPSEDTLSRQELFVPNQFLPSQTVAPAGWATDRQ